VQRNGYASLRCIAILRCSDGIQSLRAELDNEDRRAERAFPGEQNQIYGNNDEQNVIDTPCYVRFALSRDRVHKRSLHFDVGALKWLHDTPLGDDTWGCVFEYIWHTVFGRTPV
jgi:hypothetical protein